MKRDQTCRNEHTQPLADSRQLCFSVRPQWTASERKDVMHGSEYFIVQESRYGQEIFLSSETSRPVLGLTQPHIQWIPRVLSRWSTGWEANITTHLHLNQKLRMSGTTPLLLLYVFMEWTGETLPLCALKWISTYGLTTGDYRWLISEVSEQLKKLLLCVS